MLIAAIIFFAVGAIFGLTVLLKAEKGLETPKPLVFIHGLLVATGLVLVLIVVLGSSGSSPVASLVIFVIAALGGFTLLSFDLQKKPLPKALLYLHPVIAAVALVFLIIFVLK